MLNDLRQILEEDNRIESDLELMMEGTDADMVDMFIDEDGEAEIPESELTKILTKIPEYNQEEELNKKLKRLTESVIPDYDEIVEENYGFDDDGDFDDYYDETFDDFDYDDDDDFLTEGKDGNSKKDKFVEDQYRKAAAKITTEAEIQKKLKENAELYKKMSSALKIKESETNKFKSAFNEVKSYAMLGIPFIGTKMAVDMNKRLPKAMLRSGLRNNKICERVLKQRLKEIKSGKAVKESYFDLTDVPDYII